MPQAQVNFAGDFRSSERRRGADAAPVRAGRDVTLLLRDGEG